ncbi:MAG: DNRLRE domain-containing protein [Planctomycetes bacterium]|nr:DNRLRE domain-containing protein [Planctomycetota bacterium]
MKFYFCEKCGQRLTEKDVEAGQARDKKLRGVFCSDCSQGVLTLETVPMNEAEAREVLAREGGGSPTPPLAKSVARAPSSERMPAAARRAQPRGRAEGARHPALFIGGIVAGLGLMVLLVLLLRGGGSRPAPSQTAGAAEPKSPLAPLKDPVQHTRAGIPAVAPPDAPVESNPIAKVEPPPSEDLSIPAEAVSAPSAVSPPQEAALPEDSEDEPPAVPEPARPAPATPNTAPVAPEDLERGLVAWFPMDDLQDGKIPNRVPGGRNGEPFGAPLVLTPGRVGQACRFSGQPSGFRLDDMPEFPGNQGLTVSCWLQLRTLDVSSPVCAIRSAQDTGNLVAGLRTRSNGRLTGGYSKTSGDKKWGRVWVARGIPDAAWHHCAYVYDPPHALVLYVDGKAVGRSAWSEAHCKNRRCKMFVGWDLEPYREHDAKPLDGAMDDLRVYARALNEAEIQSLYAAGGNVAATSQPAEPSPQAAPPPAEPAQEAQAEYRTALKQAFLAGDSDQARLLVNGAKADPQVLALDRQAVTWVLEALDTASVDWERIKTQDSLELKLKTGAPAKVGRKEPYQVLRVNADTVFIGAKGLEVPIALDNLLPVSRFELAKLNLPRTEATVLRRAFYVTLIESKRNALQSAYDAVAKAGGSDAELTWLRAWATESAEEEHAAPQPQPSVPAPPASAPVGVVEVRPVTDGFVKADAEQIVFGNEQEMEVKWDTSKNTDRHAYIGFELAVKPEKVRKAVLRLYKVRGFHHRLEFKVERVQARWREKDLNWINKPSALPSPAVAFKPEKDESIEVEVTALLKAALAEGSWFGLRITSVTDMGGGPGLAEFCTKEANDKSPLLILTPEP